MNWLSMLHAICLNYMLCIHYGCVYPKCHEAPCYFSIFNWKGENVVTRLQQINEKKNECMCLYTNKDVNMFLFILHLIRRGHNLCSLCDV